MPQHGWTSRQDAVLLGLRAAGSSWAAIASALAIGQSAARERGRRLSARLPERAPAPSCRDDPDRDPLPAGHPTSWGVLVGDTVLHDEPYPPALPLGRRGLVVG